MRTREEKMASQRKPYFFSERFESPRETSNLAKSNGLVHCSVKNAAVCAKTIVKESRKFELARLKTKEERKKNISAVW